MSALFSPDPERRLNDFRDGRVTQWPAQNTEYKSDLHHVLFLHESFEKEHAIMGKSKDRTAHTHITAGEFDPVPNIGVMRTCDQLP